MAANDQPESRKGAEIQRLCDRAREVGSLGGMVLEAWLLEAYGLGLKDTASSETGPSEDEIERMLDNAACAAQEGGLLRDTDGTETPLREAVRLNVVNPLLRRSERQGG